MISSSSANVPMLELTMVASEVELRWGKKSGERLRFGSSEKVWGFASERVCPFFKIWGKYKTELESGILMNRQNFDSEKLEGPSLLWECDGFVFQTARRMFEDFMFWWVEDIVRPWGAKIWKVVPTSRLKRIYW
jgi:hypothetical protein